MRARRLLTTMNEFIQSCAAGDVYAVDNMLEHMNPNDATTIVAGIDSMLAHNCKGFTDVFGSWGKCHPRFGLSTLSIAFLRGNMTVAAFVLDHMLTTQWVNSSFGFLFNSGQNLPPKQRAEIAQLILQKSQRSSHGDFLSAIVNTGDEHLLDVVCPLLSDITVEKTKDPHGVDVWRQLLLCSNAVNVSGWSDDIGSTADAKRYTRILHTLLNYVDHNQLQERLEFEAIAEPEILDDTLVLSEWIQKRRREVLEQAAHNPRHQDKTVRKI